jgi:hypothetical protein
MPGRWVFPVDPECPKVEEYMKSLYDEPMARMVPADVLGELAEAWEKRHRAKCKRCQEYAAANVDVEY